MMLMTCHKPREIGTLARFFLWGRLGHTPTNAVHSREMTGSDHLRALYISAS